MNSVLQQADVPVSASTSEFFDLEALADATLHQEPYTYMVVPRFIRPEVLESVSESFPLTDGTGPFDPSEGTDDTPFQRMIEALMSPEMAAHFARRFGDDVETAPVVIKARRFNDPGDGGIHTDAKGKLVTILVYLNQGWTAEGGRLRILRSGRDMDDYAAEVAPADGTLVAFRRSDRSFHGYRHTPDERRMVQMNYVTPKKAARGVVDKHDVRNQANRAKRWLKRMARHFQAS